MEIIAKEIKTKYTIKLKQYDFEEIIMDLQKEIQQHSCIICLLGRKEEEIRPFIEWLSQENGISVSEIKELMKDPMSEYRDLLIYCWCNKNEYDIQFYGNYNAYDNSVVIVAYRNGVVE